MIEIYSKALLRAADRFGHSEFEKALADFLEMQRDQMVVDLDRVARGLLRQPLPVEDVEGRYDELNATIIAAVDFLRRAELTVRRLSEKVSRLEEAAMAYGG